jgi:hypothetical protein
VADKLGFGHHAAHPILRAPAAGYRVPGVHWAAGATAVAGAVGTLVAFGLALLLARSLVRNPEADSPFSKP